MTHSQRRMQAFSLGGALKSPIEVQGGASAAAKNVKFEAENTIFGRKIANFT